MDKEIKSSKDEILALDFTPFNECKVDLLANGTRDRLINIYDTNNGFQFLCSLDEHSSAVTNVKFAYFNKNLYLISSSSDKSIVFWLFNLNNYVQGKKCFYSYHKEIEKFSKIFTFDLSI